MANQTVRESDQADRSVRAAAVAAEYDALQGYAWAVIGLGLVLGAVTGMEAVYIALGASFSALSMSWYHRRYGMARATTQRNLRVAVGTVVVLLLLLAAWVLDRLVQPSVSITVLTLAVTLAVGQHLLLRRTGVTWVHHLVHALVLLAALGPLAGLGQGTDLLPYTLAVAGIAVIVTGLVDHHRLVRLLAPAGEDQA